MIMTFAEYPHIAVAVTQLRRYALIGIVSNAVGYLVYLLFTYFGLTPKLTITLLYGIGAAIGYMGNRDLTFAYKGNLLGSGLRYIMAHCLGYCINFCILMILVDKFGFTHQWVQAFSIFVVAGFLFIAFKFFVFTKIHSSNRDTL